MIQVKCENMPQLSILSDRLGIRGNLVLFGDYSLRLIPFELNYPTIYFNQNGSIDILASGLDLFQQADCIETLEKWIGKPIDY